jgi:hypothetical protein
MNHSEYKNCIIHLIGFAGVGKLTIAREIVSKTNAKLVDNHLINNPILSIIKAADIEAGWQACLAEQGLRKESMLKSIMPRNPLLAAVMEELPPPDSEYVNKSLAALRKFINDE